MGDIGTAIPSLSYDGDESLRHARANGEISGSGTAWDPFVIRGFSIDTYASSAVKLSNTRSHVAITGGTIRGGPTANDGWEGGIDLLNASNVVVYNVILTDIAYIGIFMYMCSEIKIVQNFLYNVSWSGIQAVSSSNITIEQNVIEACGAIAAGIFIDSNDRGHMMIASNMVVGRGITQHGIWIANAREILITENVITGCAQHGIEFTHATVSCNITENVFRENALHFILPADVSNCTGNLIMHNLFYDAGLVGIGQIFNEGNTMLANCFLDYFIKYPAMDKTCFSDGDLLPSPYTWHLGGTVHVVDQSPIFYDRAFVAGFDSDGDGLSDAGEIQVYFTHPYHSDTDFDGTPDGAELQGAKSDPLVPGSYPPLTLTMTFLHVKEATRDGDAVIMEVSWSISASITGLACPFIVFLENQPVSAGSFRPGMPVMTILPRMSPGSYTCTIVAGNGLGMVVMDSAVITVQTARVTTGIDQSVLRWVTFILSAVCFVGFLTVMAQKNARENHSRFWRA